jgi:uncharacterized membrane protein
MGLGTSIFLVAVGAILRFAVSVTTQGFNLHSVGVILMVVGGIGLAISLFWITVWSDRRRQPSTYTRREAPVVRETELP